MYHHNKTTMSRNRFIFVWVCVAIGGAVYYWRSTSEPQGQHSQASADAVSGSMQANSPSATGTTASSTAPPFKSKQQMLRGVLSAFNHQPIEFYGRVLDQSDMPVSGAQVNGQIIYNSGIASGVTRPKTVTDANGLFQFKGFQGRTLDFTIVKPGYQDTPEGDAFDFTKLVGEDERHHPDPRNPVVLRMWKLQGAEPLIVSGRRIDIVPDGRKVRIDFMTRRIVESGGDLVVFLKHDMQEFHSVPKHPYDWEAEIAAVDGGLIEVKQRETNMLQAPADGYVPVLFAGMRASQQGWHGMVTKNLYAKTRGNLYSRVQVIIQCTPTQKTSSVQVTWLMNPSGSRNLEDDPAKRIEPK
jgi:hypothetical protein